MLRPSLHRRDNSSMGHRASRADGRFARRTLVRRSSKGLDKPFHFADTSDPAQPVRAVPSGEVSERLKELVSKTSSGFILLVGSNPTLSAS